MPFELQPAYINAEGKKIRPITYVSDFVVYYPDGHKEVEDVKGSRGFMTETFKLKKKMFDFRYKTEGLFIKIVTHERRKKKTDNIQ